jgi:endonuclease YncB( thermonuclease family)
MRRLLVLGLLPLLFLPLALRGRGGTPFHFSAEVVRVIDGDTLEVRILESRGWPAPGRVEKLRLAGVDAFELSEARGVLAKALVDSLCPPGERIYGRLKPGRARDPYGRILARVYLRRGKGWVDLGEELIERKLARRWED